MVMAEDRKALSLDTIKQMVYAQLNQTSQGLVPIDAIPPLCKNLNCKCIFTQKDWDDSYTKEGLGYGKFFARFFNASTETTTLSDADKLRPADVANVCLTILRFLILDGHANLNKNLDDLYRDAVEYGDRQYGVDEIMTNILHSSYKRLFETKYQSLKAEKNHTDTFVYDLPKDASNFDDITALKYRENGINEKICKAIANCTEYLESLSHTWQKLINVLDFPWRNFPLGTFIANYNYLLDKCPNVPAGKLGTSFQTDPSLWTSNLQSTYNCSFSKELWNLHNDLGLLLTQIIPGINISMSLVDFVGLLGYSKQFDITTVKQNDFIETNKNLFPLYEWDRDESVYKSMESSSRVWKMIKHKVQCHLHVTYEGWSNYSAGLNWEMLAGNFE